MIYIFNFKPLDKC